MEGVVRPEDAPSVLAGLGEQQAGPVYRLSTQGLPSHTQYAFFLPVEATRTATFKLDQAMFRRDLEFTRVNRNQKEVKVVVSLDRVIQSSLVVVDEAHKHRSKGTKTYAMLEALRAHRDTEDAPCLVLLTGTPFRGSIKSIEFMLSLCLPPRRLATVIPKLAGLGQEINRFEAEKDSLSAEERRLRWSEAVLAPSRAILPSILYRRSAMDMRSRLSSTGWELILNSDHLDNQITTYLSIDAKTGFAPPPWQSHIGNVVVARKDKKPLLPHHLEGVWMYCDHILERGAAVQSTNKITRLYLFD